MFEPGAGSSRPVGERRGAQRHGGLLASARLGKGEYFSVFVHGLKNKTRPRRGRTRESWGNKVIATCVSLKCSDTAAPHRPGSSWDHAVGRFQAAPCKGKTPPKALSCSGNGCRGDSRAPPPPFGDPCAVSLLARLACRSGAREEEERAQAEPVCRTSLAPAQPAGAVPAPTARGCDSRKVN